MFNKKYIKTSGGTGVFGVSAVFLKSEVVKTFPSGRRRSEKVTDTDYYIPFDPEARLNTEANARKHSGLNGYTQTYLKEWTTDGRMLMSLAGYLFDISGAAPANFGTAIIDTMEAEAADNEKANIANANAIYANIILEDVHLYSSGTTLDYYTSILRDQLGAGGNTPSACLDLLNAESDDYSYVNNLDNYYFSGLSFSVEPLAPADKAVSPAYNSSFNTFTRTITSSGEGSGIDTTVSQHVVSLRLLEKVKTSGDGVTPETFEWKIYQPAYLPKIEHGTTDDSIVIYGDTTLKGTNKTFKVEGVTEISGDTSVKSNLKVDDNINVGALSDEEKATADNGGCIVAKQNITAKNDIIAEHDLEVTNNASVTGNLEVGTNTTLNNLVVGERAEGDSTDAGDLTVKKHIETPTIKATTSVTTPQGNITNAVISTATIESATIGAANIDSTITDSLTVNAVATINEADIETADIATLTGDVATIDDIVGTNTVSSANMYQNGYKVPILELVQSGTEYQLKISRIGQKQ